MHLFSLNKFSHLRHCYIPLWCIQTCSLLKFVILTLITCIYFLVGCGAQKPQHACRCKRNSFRISFLIPLCGLWDTNSGQQALQKLPQLDEPSRVPLFFQFSSPYWNFHDVLALHIWWMYFYFNLEIQVTKTHFNWMHVLNIHVKK